MGVGLVLHAGAFTLQPRIGLEYDHNDQNGFTEKGAGAANLRLAGEDRDALRTSLGARLHTAWDLGSDRSLMPEFSVAWTHDLLEPAVAIKEGFAAAKNAAFVIEGEEPPVDFFLLGLGLSYHPDASGEIFIRYDGTWAKDVQADAFTAGGKLRW
jgi:outer membrane autotransporter protein